MGVHKWFRLVAGTGFAAAVGVVTGRLISADLDWSVTASQHECAQSTGICWGIAPEVGLALGFLLTVSACWVSMAVARARPLWATVPAAIGIVCGVTVAFLRLHHGGRLHPASAFSLLIALALAVLTVAVTWPQYLWGDRP
jgi:hypothetical protein